MLLDDVFIKEKEKNRYLVMYICCYYYYHGFRLYLLKDKQ